MKLSECVGCKRPVLELEGQFDILDSYMITAGNPPPSSAGQWHLKCLRESDVGAAWQAARVRNFVEVRRHERVAEPPGWVVLRDPRSGQLLAIGASGELRELVAINRNTPVRDVDGGFVYSRIEEEFHLELDDQVLVEDMQSTLVKTSLYPVSAVLAALGIADRVVDDEALEGAKFRIDKSLRSHWGRRSVSAQIEYGVFVPHVLAPFVRKGSPSALSVAAVVADPEDEAARITYARAIAASDPERAELIDTQLQLTKWRKAGVRPAGWDKLVSREHDLISEHGRRWAADVSQLVDNRVFRRGFVEEITLPAPRFLAKASELYRRAPIVHLNLSGVRAVAAELFASPHLAQILSLSLIRNELGDAEAKLIANSRQLGNLTWLDLRFNKIGRDGLEALAASKLLPNLRYVGFADNAVPDPTPRFADEYDVDSPVAKELQAKYGPRPWLSAVPRGEWPPPRDAA